MPIIAELPKKISANDSPTIAWMPQRRIACGACSRDDPQPKLLLTSMHRRALVARHVEGWRLWPGPPILRSSSKRCVSMPVERDRAQEARGDDAVGVDVVAAHRHRTAGDRRDAPHQSNSRTSVTSPATAAAATIAGLMSSVRPVGLPCRPLKLRFDEDAHT